ncbi:MAG TPA: glycosyltransferase family 4 protein [Lacipirellulaceae bacterium]|nr:glycosyltransferase family 4 protein [Lacipirellulaceae bacterium]
MNAKLPPPGTIDEKLQERVAMLFNGDEVYGIGTILKLYATGLPRMSFVAPGDGPMVDWLKANGNRVDVVPGLVNFHEGGPSIFTVLKMPAVMRKARRTAEKFDELLRPRGIQIVHAQWRAQQITAGFMHKNGYRSVWQINNTMNRNRLLGLGMKLNHRLAKWGADLLLPASDAIGRNWDGCGVPSITIRNAAVPIFSQPNELPEQPIRCLVAGRLEHSKGHHLAVEAVVNARRAGFDVRLDIYGGPVENNLYANELQLSIAAAGCENVIRLQGFDADLRHKHQQYHLGLQCRITPEPCSLWVCETLVDGLPVIASATGGTPELVEDGVTGLLFRGGDAADLSEKLIQLARDPRRLGEMRVEAYARGNRSFTLDRFVRDTLSAYARLSPKAKLSESLARI